MKIPLVWKKNNLINLILDKIIYFSFPHSVKNKTGNHWSSGEKSRVKAEEVDDSTCRYVYVYMYVY